MESAHGVFLTAYGAIQGWSKAATAGVDQVAGLALRPAAERPFPQFRSATKGLEQSLTGITLTGCFGRFSAVQQLETGRCLLTTHSVTPRGIDGQAGAYATEEVAFDDPGLGQQRRNSPT